MEANNSDLNRTGHGVMNQSGNLQEVDSFHLLHPEIYQGGGGLNKKSNVSSSSSGSSHENMIEIVTEIQSQMHNDEVVEEHKDETLECGSETHSHDSSDGDHVISLFDIPRIQVMERDDNYNPGRIPESVFASTEALAASAEWSATSNESLFSIHPNTFSYGGDQPFFLAPEMHIVTGLQASSEPGDDKNVGEEKKLEEKEPDQPLLPTADMNREKRLASTEFGGDKNVFEEKKVEEKELDQPLLPAPEMHREKESQTSVEPGDDKYVVEETKVDEKEPSQVKIKQPNERILNLGQDETKLPSAAMIFLNQSPRSDGSDGSDYSFAFPILVSNQIQKGDGLSSRRGVSGGYSHGLESSIARRQELPPPQQQPSPRKRECWCCCCCLPFLSCFRCCFGSCCRLPSCHSCCRVQSCLSYCNFPSCYSCCASLSCKKCLCCWPCR